MGYIYKITNDVNGKIYIGKTNLINPYDRFKKHLNAYKILTYEKRPLYAAMNKYGEEHFHFEVIEETDNPEEREQYWIEQLRTYVGFKDCNGYNATLGGDGKSYLELNKNEIWNYYLYEGLSLKDTANHFNINKKTLINFMNNNNLPYLNKKDASIFRTYTKYKGIYKINPTTKIIEDIYITTNEVYENTNIDQQVIRTACNSLDIFKHYINGYLWFYGKDYNDNINKIDKFNVDEAQNTNKYNFEIIYEDLKRTKSLSKTITNLKLNENSNSYIRRKLKELGYDLSVLSKTHMIVQKDKVTNEIINIFNSVEDANIYLNKPVYSNNIRSCLYGKTKTAYGFIWDYID